MYDVTDLFSCIHLLGNLHRNINCMLYNILYLLQCPHINVNPDEKSENSITTLESSENRAKTSLGSFNSSRFILAMLAMLTGEHAAVDLSSLLTSGLLGLAQTVVRLAGNTCSHFVVSCTC